MTDEGVVRRIRDEDLFCQWDDVPSDAENAYRLQRYFGDRLRYVREWREWVAYDGTRWVENHAEAERLALATAKLVQREAGIAPDRTKALELTKWSFQCRNSDRLASMLRVASSAPRLNVSIDVVDTDPMLLNTPSGTVDLRTNVLRPHDPLDYLMKLTEVGYDPNAEAPRWHKFLEEFTAGDTDLEAFLQRLAGSGTSGVILDHVLPILIGDGGNGKSVWYETIEWVLGDYAHTIPIEVLLHSKFTTSGPTPELAKLRGKRFVIAREPDIGRRLSMGQVKNVVGGDKISACRKYKDPEEFYPTWTLVISTNNELKVIERDAGTWDRLRLVRFHRKFRDTKDDNPHLKEELKQEGPGILRWMLDGCRPWQRNGGLGVPPVVRAETEKYRQEQDLFAQWADDRLGPSPNGKVTRTTTLKADYEHVTQDYHYSIRGFANELANRAVEFGFANVERTATPSGFRGLELRSSITIKE